MLMILFGLIFSNTGESSYEIHVQDLDDSDSSKQLLEIFEKVETIDLKKVDKNENVDNYIKDNKEPV